MLAVATLLLTAASVLAGIAAIAALLDEEVVADKWHRLYATTLPPDQRWARTDLHELIIQHEPEGSRLSMPPTGKRFQLGEHDSRIFNRVERPEKRAIPADVSESWLPL